MNKTGIELIAEERKRQIAEEGYKPKDDLLNHTEGELANAAAYYALTNDMISYIDSEWGNDMHLHIYPFSLKSLKRTPNNRIKELQKAGALIAAELDRLLALSSNSRLNTVKDFKTKLDKGDIKMNPLLWLDLVATTLKECGFKGESNAEILNGIDIVEALIYYEDGWKPDEYTHECLIGTD